MNDKPVMFVSFSGGRTSGYMCAWLLENWSDKYHFIFVFANTGLEHPATLKFVDQCDKHFGLNLIWVEMVVNPVKNKGSTHVVVDYDSACRDRRLFEDMVKVYGIPNPDMPHCNRELKIAPIQDYKNSVGLERVHMTAIGMRADEIDRMSAKADELGLCYPLIKAGIEKWHVRDWWSKQPFDLEIPEHKGNCLTCWKKTDRKLFTLAKNEPELFDDFDYLEDTYSAIRIEGQNIHDRKFFRKYRSAKDMVASGQAGDFVEFEDYKPEFQEDMFIEVDELDIGGDCNGGCEYGVQ